VNRNRRLRGASPQHLEASAAAAAAGPAAPDSDRHFMDPFADFDYDQVVPISDEDFAASSSSYASDSASDSAMPLDLLRGTGPEEDDGDDTARGLLQGTTNAQDESEAKSETEESAAALDLEDSASKHGGHYREDLNNVDTPQATPYIVNGHRTRISAFVMTLDNRNGQNFRGVCGATMISATHAVTAAHCVSNYYKNDLLDKMDAGYVGPYAPWSTNGGKNEGRNYDVLTVKTVTTHPSHNPGPGSRHDIAVIEFNEAVDMGAYPDFEPMPMCNYEMTDSDSGRQGQVAGLGQTYYGGPKSEQLMEVDVNYVPNSSCRTKMLERNMAVTEDMVCFGGGSDRRDSCGGDSGGPMMVDGCLAGVVSWGYKCAEPGYPGVYTSIWHHMSWIQSVVGSSYTLQDRNGSRINRGSNAVSDRGGGTTPSTYSYSTPTAPAPSPRPPQPQPAASSSSQCGAVVRYRKGQEMKTKLCTDNKFLKSLSNLCPRQLWNGGGQVWDVCCTQCRAFRSAATDVDEGSV